MITGSSSSLDRWSVAARIARSCRGAVRPRATQTYGPVQRTGPIGASIQALGLAYRNGASRSSIASWGM